MRYSAWGQVGSILSLSSPLSRDCNRFFPTAAAAAWLQFVQQLIAGQWTHLHISIYRYFDISIYIDVLICSYILGDAAPRSSDSRTVYKLCFESLADEKVLLCSRPDHSSPVVASIPSQDFSHKDWAVFWPSTPQCHAHYLTNTLGLRYK